MNNRLTLQLSAFGLEPARSLLPPWITWVTVLWIPVLTFLMCASLSYLSARLAMFRASGLHSTAWTERARAAHPVRLAVTFTVWFCFGFIFTCVSDHENPLVQISLVWVGALCFMGAVLASTVVHHAIAPRIGDPPRPLGKRLRDFITLCLVSPGWLILAVVLLEMPQQFGARAIVLTVGGFAAFGLVLAFGTLALLSRIGIVGTTSERLAAVVKQASEKMGLRPPAVYEIDSSAANAFALVFSNQIVFTRPAIDVLDDEQLMAVASHELAHLAEPPNVKFVRLAVALVVFSVVWVNLLDAHFGMNGVFGLIAAVAAISLWLRRWQRRLEDRADAVALQNQTDTSVYATALEKTYRASNFPAVLGYGRTHSSLYDRMVAAGVTPEYTRPGAPSRLRFFAALAISAALLFLFAKGFDQWSDPPATPSRLSQTSTMLRLAIGAGGAHELAQLGDLRERRGLTGQAAAFYGAATKLSPYSVLYPAKLAASLSALGRCQEANQAWSEAKDNLDRWYYSGTVVSAAKTAEVAVKNCSQRHASSPGTVRSR